LAGRDRRNHGYVEAGRDQCLGDGIVIDALRDPQCDALPAERPGEGVSGRSSIVAAAIQGSPMRSLNVTSGRPAAAW
jgi:hypothetical protein